MRGVVTVLLVAALACTACGAEPAASSTTTAIVDVTSGPPPSDQTTPDESATTGGDDVDDVDLLLDVDLTDGRPFDVVVPTAYDGTPMPLVVLLHGFGLTGPMQDDFFHFQALADTRGFLMVTPNGTSNAAGSPFWNATDACCGFGASVDDSSYLAAVIERVQADYVVDTQRVFLIGYSNGGFMSYRMACDHAEVIAAIVSISAATFLDPGRCEPAEPVSVVEIHGTDDGTITYDGGIFEGAGYPSALQTVAQWASSDQCNDMPTITGAAVDLDRTLTGKETNVLRYDRCAPGCAVELWTIAGGGHVPDPSSSFSNEVIDFLFAHPKPPAQKS